MGAIQDIDHQQRLSTSAELWVLAPAYLAIIICSRAHHISSMPHGWHHCISVPCVIVPKPPRLRHMK